MAFLPVLSVLLSTLVIKYSCEPMSGHDKNYAGGVSQFDNLLKPPPLPPLSNIVPVPFHGGTGRIQRQNADIGYVYQPPPPWLQFPALQSQDFKFPAPFYKQYNFNFVPSPQPFTTTPSPTLFQKVSSWLFPSPQTSYDTLPSIPNSVEVVKKDCNPCNLVPWIPVIRYNLDDKNQPQNAFSTYGPPSPTAQNLIQYRPQPFYPSQRQPPQLSLVTPLLNIGLPNNIQNTRFTENPSSTYGPPSATHIVSLPSQKPASSTHSMPSSSYGIPSGSRAQLQPSYGSPNSDYNFASYAVPTSTSSPSATAYVTSLPSSENFLSNTHSNNLVTPSYTQTVFSQQTPQINNMQIFNRTGYLSDLQLPQVSYPTEFKNSYGEPIRNTYGLDIPYAVSATAAESMKISTEVLPHNSTTFSNINGSLVLANPAPFTLNKGRNIHTLQPVALPNLSISPLPPIFNARPFRTISGPKLGSNFVHGINYLQQTKKNVNIEQSVAVTEYTHSVEYPISVIQSPVIDIENSKNLNHSKVNRKVPEKFIVDNIQDISSQPSEDHVSAVNSNPDSSFETTGAEVGNDINDNPIPFDIKIKPYMPANHKYSFADLRGIKDEDVDKFRTEGNLQNIDSPLLYLKPSAPHKEYVNFFVDLPTTVNSNEFEIYDDVPTTIVPQISKNSLKENVEEILTSPHEDRDKSKTKIVQIIIPYMTSQENDRLNLNLGSMPNEQDPISEEDYQGRKVPPNTENYVSSTTEYYNTQTSTSTELPTTIVTDNYDSSYLNTAAILNDLYDVKEPPFDIIKLQHNIDDWTELEYSNHYKTPSRTPSTQYAKIIPEEYFTTNNPFSSYVTNRYENNDDTFDHEGSSSIQQPVTDIKNDKFNKQPRNYKTIERSKTKNNAITDKDTYDNQKLHVYTAATSFRSTTTTTGAPWGKIQTSISPLTKEKVYVVTSKPWRDTNSSNEWHDEEIFESKKTKTDNGISDIDSFSFNSPRFSNRPSFDFKDSVKSDSSYSFSKNWHQRINDLQSRTRGNITTLAENSHLENINTSDESLTL